LVTPTACVDRRRKAMTIQRRHLQERELDHERLWLAVGTTAAASVALAERTGLPVPRCPFKLVTSIPCPTCGATRALRSLAELDLATALAMNPMVTLGAIAMALYLLYAAFVILLGARRIRLRFDEWDWTAVRTGALLVVLGNWVYVIATGR